MFYRDESYRLVWRTWRLLYLADENREREVVVNMLETSKRRVCRGKIVVSAIRTGEEYYIENKKGFPFMLYDLMCCHLYMFNQRQEAGEYAIELARFLKEDFRNSENFLQHFDIDWEFMQSSSIRTFALQLMKDSFNSDNIVTLDHFC